MTFRIVFRRAAAAEYADAARWYEDRAAGVGHRFIRRIEQALALISEAPFRPATILAKVRRVKSREFPFFIYYLVEDSRIVVLAIFHARRNPAIWQHRK
jgi:plasmid stabilization system protein ParE